MKQFYRYVLAEELIALYIVKQKSETFLDAKITKLSHAYKGCGSIYNVGILNCFNCKLKLKGTAYAIQNNLIDL